MMLYENETSAIIGAALEVHKNLKLGLSEALYHEGMEIEMSNMNIPFVSEAPLIPYYKGVPMQKRYFADFLCYDKIIVEIKAVDELLPEHEAQLLNYLRLTQVKVGLLLNFKRAHLQIKRFML